MEKKVKLQSNNNGSIFLGKLNIAHHICNRLIGEEHKIRHRLGFGSSIILLGVIIMECNPFHVMAAKIAISTIGELSYGLGLIPFVEWAVKEGNNNNRSKYSQVRKSEDYE